MSPVKRLGAPASPLLAFAMATLPAMAHPQEHRPPPPTAPTLLAPLYQAVAAQRAKANLPPITPLPELEQLASAWAHHLADKGKLIHRDDLNRIMSDSGWWSLTENLYFSSRPFDAAGVIATWMASRPHRRNLLDTNVTHFGLGFASDACGQTFTVFNAARLTPPPSETNDQTAVGPVARPGAQGSSPIPKR